MSAQFVFELPRTSQAPGRARRWIAESFAEELDGCAQEKARLLVSELVTNAVVHGRGRMEIHAHLDRDRLLVEVIDEGPGFTPTIRERDPSTPGGDGFRIVEDEAGRWGIREGAADVWFELPRHRPGSDHEISGPVPDAPRSGEPNSCERSVSAGSTGDVEHRSAATALSRNHDSSVGTRLKVPAHPHGRGEAGFNGPDDAEAEPFVERLSGTCGYLEPMCASFPCPLACVLHERPSNSAPHAFRLNEQAIQLVGAVGSGDDH